MSNYSTEQFCVLHILKSGGEADLARLGRHIDRQSLAPNVEARRTQYNRSFEGGDGTPLSAALDGIVDSSKSKHNRELLPTRGLTLEQAVQKRIDEGYDLRNKKSGELRKIKVNAVRCLFTILTGSHERMKEIQQDEKLFERWVQANIAFAQKEFGKENIVRMTLHMDEKTPHFHVAFVPITPDKKLFADHWIGGRVKLRKLQDRYAAAMAEFDLKRGKPVEVTHAKHETCQEFRGRTSELSQDIRAEIEKVKGLNTSPEQLRRSLRLEGEALARMAANLRLAMERDQGEKTLLKSLLLEQQYEPLAFALRLDYLQRGINLPALLQQEFDSKPQEAGGGWTKYLSPEGKLPPLIVRQQGDGSWIYKNYQENRIGGIEKLLKQEAGWSWERVYALTETEAAQAWMLEAGLERYAEHSELAHETFNQWERNAKADIRAFEEGVQGNPPLPAGLVPGKKKDLEGMSGVLADAHKLLFPLYRLDREGKLRTTSTLRVSLDRKGEVRTKLLKQPAPGSKGLSMILPKTGEPQRILIFSDPLEALHHRAQAQRDLAQKRQDLERGKGSEKLLKALTLVHEKTSYVSLCRSLSKGQQQELVKLFTYAKAENQELVLCTGKQETRTERQILGMAHTAGVQLGLLQPRESSWQADYEQGVSVLERPIQPMPAQEELAKQEVQATLRKSPLKLEGREKGLIIHPKKGELKEITEVNSVEEAVADRTQASEAAQEVRASLAQVKKEAARKPLTTEWKVRQEELEDLEDKVNTWVNNRGYVLVPGKKKDLEAFEKEQAEQAFEARKPKLFKKKAKLIHVRWGANKDLGKDLDQLLGIDLNDPFGEKAALRQLERNLDTSPDR